MIVMMIMTKTNDGRDENGYDGDIDGNDYDVNSTIVQEHTFIHILLSILH